MELSNSDISSASINNISIEAMSGSASVENNTIAGSAKTGDARTKVQVYDITGRHLVAQNAVLVFVNVMGEWIGFITDAPAGARSAMLSSSATKDEYNNHQTQEVKATYDAGIHTDIQNDIMISAQTGDAQISNNTTAGNAKTGAAQAMANVVNIQNTTLSLSGWFAILLINVFGDWHGSFGTDTAYGGLQNHEHIDETPPPQSPAKDVSSNNLNDATHQRSDLTIVTSNESMKSPSKKTTQQFSIDKREVMGTQSSQPTLKEESTNAETSTKPSSPYNYSSLLGATGFVALISSMSLYGRKKFKKLI